MQKFEGHRRAVFAVQLADEHLYSSSFDNTIKVGRRWGWACSFFCRLKSACALSSLHEFHSNDFRGGNTATSVFFSI